MRILGITSRLPWPPIDGARICMYHAVRAISGLGHDVHIVCPEEGDGPFETGVLTDFATIHPVPFTPQPKVIGAVRTLFHSRPYTQLKKEIPAIYPVIDEVVQSNSFDAVYADQSHVMPCGSYVKERYGIPYLFRSHNVEHEIWQRHTATARGTALYPWLQSQTKKWKRFEISEMKKADSCAAITDRDAETIRSLVPGLPVDTIPASVDLERFPFSDVEDREESSILLIGGMDWAPNRDAAIWFVREIMPGIVERYPKAECMIVGNSPPFDELPTSMPNVRLVGHVDDIRTVYNRKSVAVIPLRVGGGMRVKIVEMMASGLPVVATSLAAEGNRAVPGKHYLQADSVQAIVDCVVELLESSHRRSELARSARQFVEREYSIDRIAVKYDFMFKNLIAAE